MTDNKISAKIWLSDNARLAKFLNMKIFLKTLFYLLIGGLAFLCLILNVHAQVLSQDNAKQVQLIKLKSDQILDEQTITPVDITGKAIKQAPYIQYSYIGGQVDNANNVIFGNNSDYSNTEKITDNQYKIFSSYNYIKDTDNFVKKIETATTTVEIWDNANVQTITDKILSLLKTPYVLANNYFATGDGAVSRSSVEESLATIRAGAGTNGNSTTNQDNCPALFGGTNTPNFSSLKRCIFSFDTSAIPDADTVDDATLYFFQDTKTDDSGAFDTILTSATPASNSTLTFADYANTGTVNYGLISFASVINGDYSSLAINSTGLSAINKIGYTALALRTSWDFNNSFTGTWHRNDINRLLTYFSAQSGTNKDPYLLVDFSLHTSTSTPATASTTPLNCMWPTNNDISIITSCKVQYAPTTSTTSLATTSLEMDHIYSPAILYFYIFSLMSACFAVYFIFKK